MINESLLLNNPAVLIYGSKRKIEEETSYILCRLHRSVVSSYVLRYEVASLFVSAPKEATKGTHFPIRFSCVLPARCQSDFTHTRLATLSLLEVRGRCQEGGGAKINISLAI